MHLYKNQNYPHCQAHCRRLAKIVNNTIETIGNIYVFDINTKKIQCIILKDSYESCMTIQFHSLASQNVKIANKIAKKQQKTP